MISIILPVWNVEEHLSECLRSIQTQSFQDYELIAVDDCSTDKSTSILEAHADDDDRIRIVRLDQNVGLGYARNSGLRVATGDYVWFMDSDDWLEPGALEAINEHLETNHTEVLIFGWRRMHSNGRNYRAGQQHLLAQAPSTFRLADWPQIMDVPQFAWNKVVSRALLHRLGIQFFKGRYQDIPYTYPVLAGATSISTLDRICVNYRQHAGQTTRTTTESHFEVFNQWERAFSLVQDYAKDPECIQPRLFRRMINHYFDIIRADRVPACSRARFFERVTSHYSYYVPAAGYDRPAGTRGIDHRLARYGSFSAYRAFMLLHPAGSWIARLIRSSRLRLQRSL